MQWHWSVIRWFESIHVDRGGQRRVQLLVHAGCVDMALPAGCQPLHARHSVSREEGAVLPPGALIGSARALVYGAIQDEGLPSWRLDVDGSIPGSVEAATPQDMRSKGQPSVLLRSR